MYDEFLIGDGYLPDLSLVFCDPDTNEELIKFTRDDIIFYRDNRPSWSYEDFAKAFLDLMRSLYPRHADLGIYAGIPPRDDKTVITVESKTVIELDYDEGTVKLFYDDKTPFQYWFMRSVTKLGAHR